MPTDMSLRNIHVFPSEDSFEQNVGSVGEGDLALVPLSIVDIVYPVGSIYMSVNAANPGTLFGGTWEALNEGRVLIGAGEAHPAGETGGEETHTLTENEMPSHTHSGSTSSSGSHSHGTSWGETYGDRHGIYSTTNGVGSGDTDADNPDFRTSSNGSHSHTMRLNNTGGGAAHNNMQPYLSVYMWKRTA